MSADPGLTAPENDLTLFPRYAIDTGTPLFRAASLPRNPWWFGSDGSQRFDLHPPRGTCYVAVDVETAIREKGRRPVLATNRLDPDFLASFALYELRIRARISVASTVTEAAVIFGASRELSTSTDYRLTCEWAAAVDAAGFDGIRYASRFTSGASANAVAIFATAGEAGWPHVRKLSGLEAAIEAGMSHLIATPPSSKTATMIRAPKR